MEGDRDFLVGGGLMYTCTCGRLWKVIAMVRWMGVHLYVWLMVEGDRDGLVGGGWMYTCRCGWWWKMFVMVW